MRHADSAGSVPIRGACWLLVAVGLAMVGGRIAVVRSSTGEVPFLGANDRSRWATVSALVDDGTYAIDRQLEIRDRRTGRRTWQTIDLVRHRGSDGRLHYYSSKPPLFPTMVAGVYAAVRSVTGLTLEQRPFFVGRWVLALVNLPMLAILYGCLVSVILRCRPSVWVALFLTAATVFGTLLTPFAITLNNHLPAAMATAVALYCFQKWGQSFSTTRKWGQSTSPGTGEKALTPSRTAENWVAPFGVAGGGVAPFGGMFLAGVAAGFAVANELPALSMAGLWGLLALRRDPLQALTAFLPGALLVAVAFFGTNWLAHETWRPAYAHRTVGEQVATFSSATAQPQAADLRGALADHALADNGAADNGAADKGLAANRAAEIAGDATGPVDIQPSRTPGRWRAHFQATDELWAIERVASDGSATAAAAGSDATDARSEHHFSVRRWDDWYDYPGSYWTSENLTGVDRGEPSRMMYAFHMLAGHHGAFSLTPLWLLSLAGSVLWLRGRRGGRDEMGQIDEVGGNASFSRLLAAAILVATVVCMLFYVARPLIDRNYGGVSVAFRWLLWLVPLWIWLAIPAAAWLERRSWGRWLGCGLLAASVFSVFTAIENPWSHPWIYHYMDYLGWIAD